MIGVSAEPSGKKTAQALGNIERSIEGAVVQALQAGVDAGVQSLKGTNSFNDRTGALRGAFKGFGSTDLRGEFAVRVDPSAAPLRGRTPPHVYARFLNFGTKRITARRFGEDAREAIERRLTEAMNALLSGALTT